MNNLKKSIVLIIAITISIISLTNIVLAEDTEYIKLSKTEGLVPGEIITLEYDLKDMHINNHTYIGFKINDKKIEDADIKIEQSFNIVEFQIPDLEIEDKNMVIYIYDSVRGKEYNIEILKNIEISINNEVIFQIPEEPVELEKQINI